MSEILASHDGCEGLPVSQHFLLRRLLQGASFARPPAPRYAFTWDVSLVLRLLESWPVNANLYLERLSRKLVTLFFLISCKWVSDVRALDLGSRSFSPDGVVFHVTRRTKSALTTVYYLPFLSNPWLCPVASLQEYECRSALLLDPSLPELLIYFKTPHRPVSCTTLARWVKSLTVDAGVDTSLFGAHSTRGASALAFFWCGDVWKISKYSGLGSLSTSLISKPSLMFFLRS